MSFCGVVVVVRDLTQEHQASSRHSRHAFLLTGVVLLLFVPLSLFLGLTYKHRQGRGLGGRRVCLCEWSLVGGGDGCDAPDTEVPLFIRELR